MKLRTLLIPLANRWIFIHFRLTEFFRRQWNWHLKFLGYLLFYSWRQTIIDKDVRVTLELNRTLYQSISAETTNLPVRVVVDWIIIWKLRHWRVKSMKKLWFLLLMSCHLVYAFYWVGSVRCSQLVYFLVSA